MPADHETARCSTSAHLDIRDARRVIARARPPFRGAVRSTLAFTRLAAAQGQRVYMLNLVLGAAMLGAVALVFWLVLPVEGRVRPWITPWLDPTSLLR